MSCGFITSSLFLIALSSTPSILSLITSNLSHPLMYFSFSISFLFTILRKALRTHLRIPHQMFHQISLLASLAPRNLYLLMVSLICVENNSAVVFFSPCLILSSTSHASSKSCRIILLHIFPLVIVMIRTSYARGFTWHRMFFHVTVPL